MTGTSETVTTQQPHAQVPVCGERTSLPGNLVPAALDFAAPGTAEEDDVQRDLRCTLQEHATGDHYAFVLHLDGPDTGSVWTRWARGHAPTTVIVLPDCGAVSSPPDREPCCEFAEHPGRHTYEIADPFTGRLLATAPR